MSVGNVVFDLLLHFALRVDLRLFSYCLRTHQVGHLLGCRVVLRLRLSRRRVLLDHWQLALASVNLL